MNGISRRNFMRMTGCAGAAAYAGLPGHLAWAATGAPRTKLRIAFYTDIHARVEWDTPVAMAKAADAIRAQQADLVICGGDCITDGFQSPEHGVEERWNAYMEMHNAIGSEVHTVLGNHDLVAAKPKDGSAPSEDPRAEFRKHLGVERTYRSFHSAGYHFVVLDSVQILREGEDPYRGYISAEQIEWLERDLSAVANGTPIILLTHIPLLTAFFQAVDGGLAAAEAGRIIVNNREVLRLFEGQNLLLVLQGHNHVDEMIRWRNTRFITGGAVCAKWWRGPWHGTEEGFGLLTLASDRVDWEYIDYGWDAKRP